MISAMSSGSGKTVVTCGLLALLKKRGFHVRSVKCGPDYIDPMFHSRVLGVSGENADLFLMGERAVRKTFCGSARADAKSADLESLIDAEEAKSADLESLIDAQEAKSADSETLIVAEGAMGFYDGIGGTTDNSAWDIADRTDTPVILVIKSVGQSISLAAQILGLLNFRKPSHICGLLLSQCSPSLYAHLTPILERETGLPVLGYLPSMPEADIPSRHLGLITADEISDLRNRFDKIGGQMERTVDVERLLGLFGGGADEPAGLGLPARKVTGKPSCRIAVARDEAFCFYYSESLDALREAGAELVFFSPIHDKCLPPHISGLYLGGGYPELYAEELSSNREMLDEIRNAVASQMPLVAECGGFLYLQKYLENSEGKRCEMAGTFAGTCRPTGHLVRFGYILLKSKGDSLLFRKGEVIPAHEFHHWDTDDNGADLEAVRARGGQPWQCAHVTDTMYAGFPHISLGGEMALAERFVEAACLY